MKANAHISIFLWLQIPLGSYERGWQKLWRVGRGGVAAAYTSPSHPFLGFPTHTTNLNCFFPKPLWMNTFFACLSVPLANACHLKPLLINNFRAFGCSPVDDGGFCEGVEVLQPLRWTQGDVETLRESQGAKGVATSICDEPGKVKKSGKKEKTRVRHLRGFLGLWVFGFSGKRVCGCGGGCCIFLIFGASEQSCGVDIWPKLADFYV